MKSATKRIIESFPVLKKHLLTEELPTNGDSKLNQVEQVFLQLARFFENPNKEAFNLAVFYKDLDNEWLEFGLELIHRYFTDGTYLIKNPTHSIITDGDYYMNQTRFADYLKENGLNFDRAKLSMYIKRGIVPQADITISGTKYWERLTCENFLEEQMLKGSK